MFAGYGLAITGEGQCKWGAAVYIGSSSSNLFIPTLGFTQVHFSTGGTGPWSAQWAAFTSHPRT